MPAHDLQKAGPKVGMASATMATEERGVLRQDRLKLLAQPPRSIRGAEQGLRRRRNVLKLLRALAQLRHQAHELLTAIVVDRHALLACRAKVGGPVLAGM